MRNLPHLDSEQKINLLADLTKVTIIFWTGGFPLDAAILFYCYSFFIWYHSGWGDWAYVCLWMLCNNLIIIGVYEKLTENSIAWQFTIHFITLQCNKKKCPCAMIFVTWTIKNPRKLTKTFRFENTNVSNIYVYQQCYFH